MADFRLPSLMLLAAVLFLVLSETALACSVVRFEEDVLGRSVRWGVLTWQKVYVDEAEDLLDGTMQPFAKENHQEKMAKESGKKTDAAGAYYQGQLQIAVIAGSERYRSLRTFFEEGGVDEAVLLCNSLNTERENALRAAIEGKEAAGMVDLTVRENNQRISEMLDVSDVRIISPVTRAIGEELILYEPQSSCGRTEPSLPQPNKGHFRQLRRDCKLLDPGDTLDVTLKGNEGEAATSFSPMIGYVLKKPIMQAIQSSTTKSIRSYIGGIVLGNYFWTNLPGTHEEALSVGPYLYLPTDSLKECESNGLISSLRCTIKINGVFTDAFHVSSSLLHDIKTVIKEVSENLRLSSGSVLLATASDIQSSACMRETAKASTLSSLRSFTDHLPIVPSVLRLLARIFSWESLFTLQNGDNLTLFAYTSDRKLIDLGGQAIRVTVNEGRGSTASRPKPPPSDDSNSISILQSDSSAPGIASSAIALLNEEVQGVVVADIILAIILILLSIIACTKLCCSKR